MAEKQYVAFKLGGEEYGLDIMNISEIVIHQEAVKLPNVPDFIDGIINYRGSVIPIICLKKRFNIKQKDTDNNTRIIIININNKQVGFIVDEVSQTIKIEDDNIEPAPDIVSGIDIKFIIGVGKVNDRLVLLVDLEKVITDEQRDEIYKISV